MSLRRFYIVFRLTSPTPSLLRLHILPLELGSPAADTPALMKFAVPQESRTSPHFLSRQMWTGNPSSRLSSSAEFLPRSQHPAWHIAASADPQSHPRRVRLSSARRTLLARTHTHKKSLLRQHLRQVATPITERVLKLFKNACTSENENERTYFQPTLWIQITCAFFVRVKLPWF